MPVPRRARDTEPRREKEDDGMNEDDGAVLKKILALREREGEERRQEERDFKDTLLKEIMDLRGLGQARATTCQQAVLRCEREACGKAPLYYYDKVTPVTKAGGVPWAACVQVNGRCECGGTLIRDTWIITSATCMADVR